MNMTRSIVLAVLFCLSASAVWAQPASKTPYAPPTALPRNGDLPAESSLAYPGALSDWIVYRRECCEGRHGRLTPLYTELYLSAGPSFPVGGTTLSRELQTGWSIAGGARVLLFDEPLTRAWVVDLHLINTNESGINNGRRFPLTIFRTNTRQDFGVNGTPGLTVKNSNRTLFGVGFGREWYLAGNADAEGPKWRFGVDVGGRYGSHNLAFNETRHITDVIGSLYVAGHSDLEFLWRDMFLHAGLRLEWAYTWSDILQRKSDVQELSLLFAVGVRY